jgi:hypothetical protein
MNFEFIRRKQGVRRPRWYDKWFETEIGSQIMHLYCNVIRCDWTESRAKTYDTYRIIQGSARTLATVTRRNWAFDPDYGDTVSPA